MQFALGCHVMNTERIWGMSIRCLQGKVLQEARWAVKRLWLFCQGAISRCQFHQGCGISLFCLPAKRSCQAVPATMSSRFLYRFLIQSKTRREIHASWLLVTSPTLKQNRAIQRPRNMYGNSECRSPIHNRSQKKVILCDFAQFCIIFAVYCFCVSCSSYPVAQCCPAFNSLIFVWREASKAPKSFSRSSAPAKKVKLQYANL